MITPKEFQKKLGLTIEGFSRHSEVTMPTIGRWKNMDAPKNWLRDQRRALENLKKIIAELEAGLGK